MMQRLAGGLLLAAAVATAGEGLAATEPGPVVPPASVAVNGTATATVQNDRMQATLRAEAEQATAAAAASDVNARMARALAKAKAASGIETRTAGYSTWQTWEKGRPAKWRVAQSIALTGSDFAALAALVSRLQDEDGMLVSGIVFSVSTETRRKTEDALTREAIRAWQQRATTAADALGYASWRTGRIAVGTNDAVVVPRADMMMRAQAAPAAGAPIAVEGGTTEITVTVTGDAMLENPKPR
jgi:predicted secreted protein